jgi:hypothetical protein
MEVKFKLHLFIPELPFAKMAMLQYFDNALEQKPF